jgi:hypothetical protein
MASRALLLFAFMAFFPAVSVRAADIPKFSGSDVPVEDAIAKSNTVFEGKVTELGEEVPYSYPPVRCHLYATVKVLHVLRGREAAYEVVWIIVDFTRHQEPPKVGISYIFCVTETDPDSKTIRYPTPVLKMLSASDENIALAKKLISN